VIDPKQRPEVKVGVTFPLSIPVDREDDGVSAERGPSIPVDREDMQRKLRASVIVDAQWPQDAGLTVILLRIALCGEKKRTQGISSPGLIPFIAEDGPKDIGLGMIAIRLVVNQGPGRDRPGGRFTMGGQGDPWPAGGHQKSDY
jgi:hypothetical protein